MHSDFSLNNMLARMHHSDFSTNYCTAFFILIIILLFSRHDNKCTSCLVCLVGARNSNSKTFEKEEKENNGVTLPCVMVYYYIVSGVLMFFWCR